MDNILLVHMSYTLTDLSHISNAVGFSEVIVLFHQAVKQFTTTKPAKNINILTWVKVQNVQNPELLKLKS